MGGKRLRRIRKRVRRGWKGLRRATVYGLTLAVRRAMVSLPLPWAREACGAAGALAFHLLPGERRKTLENLRIAYGEALTPHDARRLGARVFRNAGRSAAEMFFVSAGRGRGILEAMEVEGGEHVEGVLAEGRGVLALTAHFGNWELLLACTARRFDCEVGAVARPLSNPLMNRLVVSARERGGARVLQSGRTGKEYVRFLRRGNLLGIVGDMDTSRGEGLFVDFFGRPAWTQTGIARLARVGRARIVPAFVYRDPERPGLQRAVFGAPIEEPPADAGDAQWIRLMTERFTRAIEDAVRKQPDQWMWMHRRWRRRPGALPEKLQRLELRTDETDAS